MKEKKNRQDVVQSFNVAIEGIIETIKTERNMKFHAFCMVVVVIITMSLGVTRMELIDLALSMSFVMFAELINTAIEAVVDMVSPEYNLLAKKAKDIAAGAVFLAATNAMIVGYLIFHNRITFRMGAFFDSLKNSYTNVIIFTLVLVTVLVIGIKALFNKGTPLRGGIPSGHSALAGALFVGIFFLTNDKKIFYLSFLLVVMVIQSRIEGKIHTVLETILGVILGMGITYLFLTFLKL